jgi:hypothetical protein
MKYKMNVEVTETYEVIVEADSPEKAEELALDMEYTEMKFLDSTAETFVVDEVDTPKTRNERLQAAADAGFDTWEDYRGEK